jgi:hypothetical protein
MWDFERRFLRPVQEKQNFFPFACLFTWLFEIEVNAMPDIL